LRRTIMMLAFIFDESNSWRATFATNNGKRIDHYFAEVMKDFWNAAIMLFGQIERTDFSSSSVSLSPPTLLLQTLKLIVDLEAVDTKFIRPKLEQRVKI
jgi:hypothetical protein